MAMGANTLAEALIDLGACDGLDKAKCAQATLKMISLGEKGRPFAARIMGEDFETFRRQWRRAFEKFEQIEPEEKTAKKKITNLWEDVGAEVE